jgi:hypothetical protein
MKLEARVVSENRRIMRSPESGALIKSIARLRKDINI